MRKILITENSLNNIITETIKKHCKGVLQEAYNNLSAQEFHGQMAELGFTKREGKGSARTCCGPLCPHSQSCWDWC